MRPEQSRPKVAFATLGCKANQFDSTALQDQLAARTQAVDFEECADVYVINTCSVTHKGDADARRLIRQAKRTNPDAKVIVTGCYAQTQPDAVASLPEVSHVVGNSHKDRVPDLVVEPTSPATTQTLVAPLGYEEATPELPPISGRVGGTRAFVKIQDGCDYSCTFCITTIARGRHRSVPLDEIIAQIRALEARGVQEVVLTGVQIGRFGRDLRPKRTLDEALQEILAHTQIPRVRVSSIDPREVTQPFLELVAAEARLCPHLHIPVQSGDDAILMLMRRNYDRRYLQDLFAEIRRLIPDCLIGSDMIVGFPGEGPAEFDLSMDLLARYLNHVHVFSYSDRPGTAAAALPGEEKCPPDVVKRRSRYARSLAARKRRAFADALVGSVQEVLLETGVTDGYRRGYTRHYVPIWVPEALGAANTLIDVRIVVEGERHVGHPA